MSDTVNCSVCAKPLKRDDICASDIEMGPCHAECLEGSPVVDLESGQELPDGNLHTYPFSEISDPPPPSTLLIGSQALSDVAAERQRQVEAEGWTPEHDDAHETGELLEAAKAYFTHATDRALVRPGGDLAGIPFAWPWDKKWWKPKTPRQDLVRAAALALAEIDRIKRRYHVRAEHRYVDAEALYWLIISQIERLDWSPSPQPNVVGGDTIEYTFRAMAQNYAGGHSWDHLDGEACTKAADEIRMLRAGIKRLSDEEELCAETTGDDPFSLVHLAAKLAATESDLRGMRIALDQAWESNRERQGVIDRMRKALEPFAEVAGRFDGVPVSAILPQQCWFTPHSLREARAALATTEGSTE